MRKMYKHVGGATGGEGFCRVGIQENVPSSLHYARCCFRGGQWVQGCTARGDLGRASPAPGHDESSPSPSSHVLTRNGQVMSLRHWESESAQNGWTPLTDHSPVLSWWVAIAGDRDES